MSFTKKCALLSSAYFLIVEVLFVLVFPAIGICKIDNTFSLAHNLAITFIAGCIFWLFSVSLTSLICILVMLLTLGTEDAYIQILSCFFGFVSVSIANFALFQLAIHFFNSMFAKNSALLTTASPVATLFCFAILGLLFATVFWFTFYDVFVKKGKKGTSKTV